MAEPKSTPQRVEPDFSAEKYTVPATRGGVPRQWDRSGENPGIREVQDRVAYGAKTVFNRLFRNTVLLYCRISNEADH